VGTVHLFFPPSFSCVRVNCARSFPSLSTGFHFSDRPPIPSASFGKFPLFPSSSHKSVNGWSTPLPFALKGIWVSLLLYQLRSDCQTSGSPSVSASIFFFPPSFPKQKVGIDTISSLPFFFPSRFLNSRRLWNRALKIISVTLSSSLPMGEKVTFSLPSSLFKPLCFPNLATSDVPRS